MRNIILALALAASVAPIAAVAQGFPQLSPDQIAKIQQARSDARTAALAALSANHRTKVQAVVDQVDGGTLDPKDAVTQLDAILTPDESKAVLDQGRKMMETVRAVMPPPEGSDTQRPAGANGQGNRTPDAGRTLLRLLVQNPMVLRPQR